MAYLALNTQGATKRGSNVGCINATRGKCDRGLGHVVVRLGGRHANHGAQHLATALGGSSFVSDQL
jgi:hypothetical protein